MTDNRSNIFKDRRTNTNGDSQDPHWSKNDRRVSKLYRKKNDKEINSKHYESDSEWYLKVGTTP